MALVLTRVKDGENVFGNQRSLAFDVAFDSTYNSGGEPLTPRQLGLKTVHDVRIMQPGPGGIAFVYDIANAKLKAEAAAGASLLTEDTGIFAAGTPYTLKQSPGYVLSVRGSAGSTGPKSVLPIGETLAAAQCSVNWTTGVVTWGDATMTRATILYVPRGTPGFTPDLMVVDEAAPIASNVITLTNRAMAIQYVWNDEDNELLVPVTDNVALTGAQCLIQMNASGSSTITVTAGRIADGSVGKTKVTYLKYVGNPLTQIDKQDVTITANATGPGVFAALFATPSIAIPGYGVHLAVSDTTGPAQRLILLQDKDGTSAALNAIWNPATNSFVFNATDSADLLEQPFLMLNAGSSGNAGELPNNSDLSWVTGLRLVATGF
jgi:hypothetical protein